MKRLLLGTALVAALSGQMVWSQDATTTMPTITAPEGYARAETMLTADQLLGATIYDANGDSVGEVHDLVFEKAPAATTGAMNDTSATTTGNDATARNNDANATASTTTTATDNSAAATTTGTAGQDAAMADAAISHAILDVGGFLGMGEHRVAVPVTDLAIYKNGDDVRVYLPWTKDQLKALPSYDPDDPNTLGRSMLPPAN